MTLTLTTPEKSLPSVNWYSWLERSKYEKVPCLRTHVPQLTRAQFHGLLTAEFCAYDDDSPLVVQAPNFWASLVSLECRVTGVRKCRSQNSPLTREKFPASVSADSALTVSRAMKLGPGQHSNLHFVNYRSLVHYPRAAWP